MPLSLQTMYALVLFDIDGCTAIIDAKKFKVPDAKALCKGQQVSVQYQKKSLKVEVLELSGNFKELQFCSSCTSV